MAVVKGDYRIRGVDGVSNRGPFTGSKGVERESLRLDDRRRNNIYPRKLARVSMDLWLIGL